MLATISLIIASIQLPVPLYINRPRHNLIKTKNLKLIPIMRRHRKLSADKSFMSNGGCSFLTQQSRSRHGERSPRAPAAFSFPGKLYNLVPLLAPELLRPERNLVEEAEPAEKLGGLA